MSKVNADATSTDTDTGTNTATNTKAEDEQEKNNQHRSDPATVDNLPLMECPVDGCVFAGVDRQAVQNHCRAMTRHTDEHPSWSELVDDRRAPIWYCTYSAAGQEPRYHVSVCTGVLDANNIRSIPLRIMQDEAECCGRCRGDDWVNKTTGPSLADKLRSDNLRGEALEQLGYEELSESE